MTIHAYLITADKLLQELHFDNEDQSLDGITRHLPAGLYSTFRTYDLARKVIGLSSHLGRLFGPSLAGGVNPAASPEALQSMLREILSGFVNQEVRVRICLSMAAQAGDIFVLTEPFNPPGEEIYQRGVKVVTSQLQRTDPRKKSTQFIQASTAERNALHGKGYYEALMVRNGALLEGLTSNFYAYRNPAIITAQRGILLGVTRRVVLGLLRKMEIPIDFRALPVNELSMVDEAFITSSSRGVVPVVEIDGFRIGEGKPGTVAQSLRAAYERFVVEKAELI